MIHEAVVEWRFKQFLIGLGKAAGRKRASNITELRQFLA